MPNLYFDFKNLNFGFIWDLEFSAWDLLLGYSFYFVEGGNSLSHFDQAVLVHCEHAFLFG